MMRRSIEEILQRVSSRLRATRRRDVDWREIDGIDRIIRLTIDSKHLKGARDVLLYLPPSYAEEPGKRYPVFYVQDGQNLFFDRLAFGGHSWRLRETADRLIEQKRIEPLIIAGIFHGGSARIEEYTQTRDRRHRRSGRGETYERFVLEELKPAIEARFPTASGSDGAAIGGSSLGGLAALSIALRHPEVFGRVAALSPSVWWDDRMIVRMVQRLPRSTDSAIWIDVGDRESDTAVSDARRLRDALIEKGWDRGRLRYVEVTEGAHHESAWGERMPEVLQFLFPPRAEKERSDVVMEAESLRI
ncbi:MAG TPA: alpha/beta hydrolase-fold protein [Thermoanaerobaculia bacterium]|nr:alpha/beta hydrolase-fold protein [Thermoanaerobaculia bacterium]